MIRAFWIPLLLVFSSCDNLSRPDKNTLVHDTVISGLSVYQDISVWLNQDRKQVQLSESLGKVHLIALIYTSCPNVCPKLVNDMKVMEDELPNDILEQIRFTLVTIDPETDTPEQLKAFAEEWQLDLSRWQLLNGTNDQVLELAAMLNVKFKRVSETDFSHSILISVLNRKGELVYAHEGMNADIPKTMEVIIQIIKTQKS